VILIWLFSLLFYLRSSAAFLALASLFVTLFYNLLSQRPSRGLIGFRSFLLFSYFLFLHRMAESLISPEPAQSYSQQESLRVFILPKIDRVDPRLT